MIAQISEWTVARGIHTHRNSLLADLSQSDACVVKTKLIMYEVKTITLVINNNPN